jgi:16S rRNA (cytosine1407-C5)-methyltransferase
MSLPAAFLQRLGRILPPEQLEECLRTFDRAPVTAFRVNTLKAEPPVVAAELGAAGFHLAPLPWRGDAFTVPGGQRRDLTCSAAFREARIYIQNPASMVPATVLDAHPDEWVLDLAAAPGGKTLQLAAMMRNRGRLSAVESVRSRFHRLRRNLEDGGVTCAHLYLRDGTGVGRSCPGWFDRVLLDAPCSGEGRFRTTDPDTYRYWSERKIGEMARKQRRLLYSAVDATKVGGTLVYATCTFAPEENELIIDAALRRFGQALAVESVDLSLSNASPGLTSWGRRSLAPELERTVRLLPDGAMEGFYLARLRKADTTAEERGGRGRGGAGP